MNICNLVLVIMCLAGASCNRQVQSPLVADFWKAGAAVDESDVQPGEVNMRFPATSHHGSDNGAKFAQMLLGFHPQTLFTPAGRVARSPIPGDSWSRNRQHRCGQYMMSVDSSRDWKVSKLTSLEMDMKTEDTIADLLCDLDLDRGFFYFKPFAKMGNKKQLENLRDIQKGARLQAVVARSGKETVGFGTVAEYAGYPFEWIKDDIPVVGNIVVKQELRRCGMARALLQDLEDIVVRDWNCGKIYVAVLSINKAALKLYDKTGYTKNEEQDGVVLLSKNFNFFDWALATIRGIGQGFAA
mmetsp:Transcript_76747/g.136006  ORF Transcript_76747/g.136006 Transcript_76747/m.136006 type:complete len:299 (-) Transcript_76747:154-1050(-)